MRLLLALSILLAAPPAGAQSLRAIQLPGGGATSAGTTLEELAMVRIGVWRAGRNIDASERPALAAAMDAAYARMHARVGTQPSIFVASQRGQRARAFDALIAEPEGAPRVGVVFLHGSGGNFTWSCFAVAEAVVAEGGVVLCPSVGTSAQWGSGEGPAIVEASIAALEARGIERIVLAGLSSGGVGASRVLPRVEARIDGLVLLSGARPRRTSLPVLLVHGDRDRMMPIAGARAFARRSPSSTLVALPGGHFVLAERTDEVQRHLRSWLQHLHDPAEPTSTPLRN